MDNFALAMIIKPLFMLVVFGCIVIPVELLVKRYLPEGKLKRILFKRIS